MKKLPATEKAMHIGELALLLGIAPRTVRRYVDKLYPDYMKNGVTTWLDQTQVTAVKLDLEKNKHLDTSVQLPKTDLEKKLLIQQAMGFLNEEILELRNQLTNAQPKIEFHDQVGDSAGLYSMGETAKVLGTGRNRLFDRLRDEKIFFGREPYQDFINRGYFELKTTTKNEHIQKQAFCTPKGLQWLHEKFTGLTLKDSLVKQIGD